MSTDLAVKPARAGVETLAITGSKGGVGKSNLVLNLAVCLGRWGRRVLLVDGDLGLANIDVLLGMMPTRTVEHLVRGDAALSDVLLDGPLGVRLLPAASGVPQLTDLDAPSRARLLQSLKDCVSDVDDILIDTGAGLGSSTLSLQLAASRVAVVTTPEPTSIVDAYATLKVIWAADPAKPVDLVVNAADDEEDAGRVYEQIAKAADHFLGRRPGWLGAVQRDRRVAEAVRSQRPVVELFPHSDAARCYEKIALRLASGTAHKDPALDYWDRLFRLTGEEVPH